jgi:hypothetical protein
LLKRKAFVFKNRTIKKPAGFAFLKLISARRDCAVVGDQILLALFKFSLLSLAPAA